MNSAKRKSVTLTLIILLIVSTACSKTEELVSASEVLPDEVVTVEEFNYLKKEFNIQKNEIDALSSENIELNEKVQDLELIVENIEKELLNITVLPEKEEDSIGFTMDTGYWNNVQSNYIGYRLISNNDGVYLVNNDYKPLHYISNDVEFYDNCWSPNDVNILLTTGYEWFTEYYVYNIKTNQMNKLFDNDIINIVGEYTYENKQFGYISNFIMWISDDKMILVESSGLPKDGSEQEYRERGYRSDIFMYDWKKKELMRLTDAEDGEYYVCLGLDETESFLLLDRVQYNEQSEIVDSTRVELEIEKLVYGK